MRFSVSGIDLRSYVVGTNFIVGDTYLIVLAYDSTASQSLTGATIIDSSVTGYGTTHTGTFLGVATNSTIRVTTRGGVLNSCFTLG